MKLEVVFILFWLYAFLGFLLEVIVTYIRERKLVNRGFLLGPYCPIYGTGGIILLTLNNYQNRPILIFLVSIVICSFIEYVTSYLLELIYKVRWWDYSNRFFNVNGRICLTNSIAFGILGILLVCYLNPWFLNLLSKISGGTIKIISLIILVVTLIDIFVTFSIMFDIRKTVANLKPNYFSRIFKSNSDNTEEISKKMREILKEKTFIHKHLSKTYSNLKVYGNYLMEKKDNLIKYRKMESIFVLGCLVCLIFGFIIGRLIHKVSLTISIFLLINSLIMLILNRGRDEK